MTTQGVFKIILETIGILILFFIIVVYCFINGIPFIEGTTEITKGEGYGFKIGMTKEECFGIVKQKYAKEKHIIYSFIKQNSINDMVLKNQPNLTPMSARHKTRLYKEFLIKIKKINSPLKLGYGWRIDVPSLVEKFFFLDFQGDILEKITLTKIIFHRK